MEPIEEGTYEQMKDWDAFKAKEGICYVPEAGDATYTYQDILEIAKGKHGLAVEIFGLCDWQHPETIFDEMFRDEEIDELGNVICP